MKPTECETKQLFEAIEMWFARDKSKTVPHGPWSTCKHEPLTMPKPNDFERW